MRLRLIGHWRGKDDDQPWPDPNDFVDWSWDEKERSQVVRYLYDSGDTLRAYRGRHQCRLCDRWQGAIEMTDGTYVWPEGLTHYLLVHGVRLPDEFVRHVTSRGQDLRSAAMDTSWWLGQSLPPGPRVTRRPSTVYSPWDDISTRR